MKSTSPNAYISVEVRLLINPADPRTITKFVDPLPIPPVLRPIAVQDGRPHYHVRMMEAKQRLHRDFPPTTVWGYNGLFPGPIFETFRDQPISVHWENTLPEAHLLTIDHTIHGAESFRPAVRTVVHLHGSNTPAAYDGNPDQWYARGLTEVGPRFVTDVFQYPNKQPATTLWYHDHAIGITRLNMYAGLTGMYIIRDTVENHLPLPRGPYELPLLIQDRTFHPDGSLSYPAEWEPEFFGNTMLVNGALWPFAAVEPRRYRLRLVNGCNARTLRVAFQPELPFHIIGTDGGLMDRTATESVFTLAPAERIDTIVDFTDHSGASFTLTNSAPAPFPGGDAPDEHTSVIMQFRVTLPRPDQDDSAIPSWLVPPDRPALAEVSRIRDVTLLEFTESMHGTDRLIVLQGTRGPTGRPQPYTWGDGTTECPQLGATEIWRMFNTTQDTHPMHLHLVRFYILDRQPYDVKRLTTTGELVFTGPPRPPEPYELGPKDTVQANPGEVTRIIVWFGDYAGEYVWHCHILEHEDNEMMRRMDVRFPSSYDPP